MTLARVTSVSLGQEVSAIGFGCASLGSRVAAASGLRALECAFDEGVTWFDVAPSYGDGQAEALLGRFLSGRRDRVQVLTKIGIAPPQPSLRQTLVRPVLRLALAGLPALRSAIRKHRPPATKMPINAALIPASVEASLRRLGTDYVDVLALHDATPEETSREDVIAALDQVWRAGKARAIAIASSPEAAAAGMSAWEGYRLAQFAENPYTRGVECFAAAAPGRLVDVVTHSTFGVEGRLTELTLRIDREPSLRTEFEQSGYIGSPQTQAMSFLFDYAITTNAQGVVLMSMFKRSHLVSNIIAHGQVRDKDTVIKLAERLSA